VGQKRKRSEGETEGSSYGQLKNCIMSTSKFKAFKMSVKAVGRMDAVSKADMPRVFLGLRSISTYHTKCNCSDSFNLVI